MRIVGIAGNLTRPSRTRTLVDAVLAEAAARGLGETESSISSMPGRSSARRCRATARRARRPVLSAIESADVLVAASPVYKASYTGLFKHLFDLLDPKALEGRHVLLAATGGSDRHALVIEHQMRPLFAFFGAHILPVSLYAVNAISRAPGSSLPRSCARIARAVDQITALCSMAGARGRAKRR